MSKTYQANNKKIKIKGLFQTFFCQVCQIKPCAMYFTKKKMDCLSSAGFDFPMSVTQGGNNYRLEMSALLRSQYLFRPFRIEKQLLWFIVQLSCVGI